MYDLFFAIAHAAGTVELNMPCDTFESTLEVVLCSLGSARKSPTNKKCFTYSLGGSGLSWTENSTTPAIR